MSYGSSIPMRYLFCLVLIYGACSDDDGGQQQNNNQNQPPAICGNGAVEGLEECDDGSANSDSTPDACRTSCLQASCGDGQADTGEECDEGPQNSDVVPDACRTDCLHPACGDTVVDVMAGETCDCGADSGSLRPGCVAPNGHADSPCGSTCIARYCGNGIIDPGEDCDEGDIVAGDGCGPTCLTEGCGNSFVDPGEHCDDGGVASHDGCSSRCRAEIPEWRSWESTLERRYGSGLAYDQGRGRLVRFGGGVTTETNQTMLFNDTWEHDGQAWRRVRPVSSPPARIDSSLTYDVARNVVVLFGGTIGWSGTDPIYANDTWEYDGEAWLQVSSTQVPTARAKAGFAFDEWRGIGVLYGGEDASGPLNDHWELWSGQWVQRTPASSPPECTWPSLPYDLAYDRDREAVVLFDNDQGAAAFWEYDGQTWNERPTGVSPSERFGHKLVFDALRGRMVLHGGYRWGFGPMPYYDTWVGSGTDWMLLAGLTGTPGVSRGLVYDDRRNLVLGLFYDGTYPDLWALQEGRRWEREDAAYRPTRRTTAKTMLFDEAAGTTTLLLPRQQYGNQTLGFEVWDFDGADWSRRAVTGPLLDLHGASASFDAHRGCAVITGWAERSPGIVDWEVWDLCGTEASKHSTAPTPARDLHGMAFDRDRGRTVIFGGASSDPETWDSTPLADTWEHDGSSWTEVSLSVSPSARWRHQMVYDERRQRVVLFGGTDVYPNTFADTWEYDGAAWSETTPTASPPGRFDHAMAFHAAVGRVLLFGGNTEFQNEATDTWEYDGSAWMETTPIASPQSEHCCSYSAIAYDRLRRMTVAYFEDGTWLYRYASPGASEICDNAADDDGDNRADCADPDCDSLPCGPRGLLCRAQVCECPGGSTETSCDDRADDDCDGQVDCADSDCAGFSACEGTEFGCDDGFDNDGDGLTDCADPDCLGSAGCEAEETSCSDGLDNDGDGATDRDDLDCRFLGQETECLDGLDNDFDGLEDCWDPDCAASAYCSSGGSCGPVEDIALGVSVLGDSTGAPRRFGSLCGPTRDEGGWDYPGPERIYRLTAPSTGYLCVDLNDTTLSTLTLFVLGALPSGACEPSYRCEAIPEYPGEQSAGFYAFAGETYYLVVDGYEDGGVDEGSFSLLAVDCN